MWQAIKNVVLWDFGRTTWQYDVLCILILAFIFLTPKSWFESKGREQLSVENTKITRLVVNPDVLSCESDENLKLQRVRELSGNENAQIVGCRKKTDASGKLIAYEVDVR
jgi:hypothetical protein